MEGQKLMCSLNRKFTRKKKTITLGKDLDFANFMEGRPRASCIGDTQVYRERGRTTTHLVPDGIKRELLD